jgi:enoyl-CoA hydratase/carnithine racemase
MTDEVLYEMTGGVARVTINRPERRNAMSYGVMSGLRDAMANARDDEAVRVVVLTGAGDKAFCAGADLTGIVSPRTTVPRPRTKGVGTSRTSSATCGRWASRSSLAYAVTPSPAGSGSRARAT